MHVCYVFRYVGMHVSTYMQVCNFGIIQINNYASMSVFKDVSMQGYMYASIQVNMYANMQTFSYSRMHVCNYITIQLHYLQLEEKYAITLQCNHIIFSWKKSI